MDEINVYAYTTATHSFQHKLIVGHFLVECIKDGELYTYPPVGKDTFESWQDAMPDRATAYLLTRAVNVVKYYLGLTKDVETVKIYIDEIASRPFKNEWPLKWEASGYLTAHGTEVKNREVWEQYNTYIHKLDDVNLVFMTLSNSYEVLMHEQAKKKLSEILKSTSVNS